MKDYIETRVLDIAYYVLERGCTIREAADAFCISKSTAHKDLSERLPQINKDLFDKIGAVLCKNWSERYIRGGEATKRKYKSKKNAKRVTSGN